jgi:hypothetical protein
MKIFSRDKVWVWGLGVIVVDIARFGSEVVSVDFGGCSVLKVRFEME